MLINLEQKKTYYDIDIKTNYSNLKDSSIGLFIVMAITIKLIWKKNNEGVVLRRKYKSRTKWNKNYRDYLPRFRRMADNHGGFNFTVFAIYLNWEIHP